MAYNFTVGTADIVRFEILRWLRINFPHDISSIHLRDWMYSGVDGEFMILDDNLAMLLKMRFSASQINHREGLIPLT